MVLFARAFPESAMLRKVVSETLRQRRGQFGKTCPYQGSMIKRSLKRRSQPEPGKQTTKCIRWDELPHAELRNAAVASMGLGSRVRASEDARLHVLTRRLWKQDAADHMNYVEIINGRNIELLRAIRDEYRQYLKQSGARPLAEMYWVVARFGVMDWAIMILRRAVFEYVGHCRLKTELWESLYGLGWPKLALPKQIGRAHV